MRGLYENKPETGCESGGHGGRAQGVSRSEAAGSLPSEPLFFAAPSDARDEETTWRFSNIRVVHVPGTHCRNHLRHGAQAATSSAAASFSGRFFWTRPTAVSYNTGPATWVRVVLQHLRAAAWSDQRQQDVCLFPALPFVRREPQPCGPYQFRRGCSSAAPCCWRSPRPRLLRNHP